MKAGKWRRKPAVPAVIMGDVRSLADEADVDEHRGSSTSAVNWLHLNIPDRSVAAGLCLM